jgi:hypothetical protein
MLTYEHRGEQPLTHPHFVRRMLRHVAFGAAFMLVSLVLGVVGYHMFAGFGWVDSFLNASMLLGGMGEVDELRGDGAKIFGGLYALYAGIVFLILTGTLLAPVLHRVLHRFHWEADQARHASRGDER